MDIPDQIWKLKLKRVPESFGRSPGAQGRSETQTFCFLVPCPAQEVPVGTPVHFPSSSGPQDPKSILPKVRSLSTADATNSRGNKLAQSVDIEESLETAGSHRKLPLDSAIDYQLGTDPGTFLVFSVLLSKATAWG